MRSINEVLREKEMRIEVLRDEIEKLKIAARILDASDQPGAAVSEPPRPVVVNKNWP